ncbi:MAG: ribonuclease R [Defluviitaleaceae bacterium]|nr:ribonuclease R [Defluviitaleaceae bacterium]
MKKNPTKKTKFITGKFTGNERGYGFVARNDGEGEDIFIPPHMTSGALHGDEVICVLESPTQGKTQAKSQSKSQSKTQTKSQAQAKPQPQDGEKQTALITEITKRSPFIGTVLLEDGDAYVRPVEKKLPYLFSIPQKSIARFGLVDGHRVVFSVDKRYKPEARLAPCFVTEVVGHVNDPGMDVLTLVMQAGVPYKFADEVMEEVKKIPTEVLQGEAENRLDLRDEFIFTIDGEDTKDIDDAISFAKTENGFRLGVHIADVSHYVRQNTELDTAALNRATSIYLADRVIPMLPHQLSSGICSLFPNVDRLTLSCIMDVDGDGVVTDYKITPSIINSKKRYTYTEVQALIGADEKIDEMNELREILRKKRKKRGALDFDIPEAKIRVDESGRVTSIEPYPRNNATEIIEEFMILCNETIAAHFLAKETPFVYRSHESPSREKLSSLQVIAATLKIPAPTVGNLQHLLETAKNTAASYSISAFILRAMPQAAYTHTNPTHFGLASQAYCHFTSPIRRYADLQIHRIIKGEAGEYEEALPSVCAQCSRAERTAETLERDVADLKKVQFMADKRHKTFDAIVSGVTSWGIYVMLNNTAEGLVPSSHLVKWGYKFYKDEAAYKTKRRKGEKSVNSLYTGVPVRVKLVQVNEEDRRLSFVIVDGGKNNDDNP